MTEIAEILSQQAGLNTRTTASQRLLDHLAGEDELAFGALSLGDVIYDRISIDPAALEAFEFVTKPRAEDIYKLATWSANIEDTSIQAFEGDVNRLQGYVFERMAAVFLRQHGAVVEFPDTANNPGWDFLVNGEPVQAKCGMSPDLVYEHLQRYPNIPRVIVNQDLGSHFEGNDHIEVIHGLTRDAVRTTTEHSLSSAADMLDVHLDHLVPAISVARNCYALWRRTTDWQAVPTNIAVDATGRFLGGAAGHAIGLGAAACLGGWPAILIPVCATAGGYRGGRIVSDLVKREFLLREESAALASALSNFCSRTASVLQRMIIRAARSDDRFMAARSGAHPDYTPMFDDWQQRLASEQDFRTMHMERFIRGAQDPSIFGEGNGLLSACAAAMFAASKAGLLPADLTYQRKSLANCIDRYVVGLRRRLLKA